MPSDDQAGPLGLANHQDNGSNDNKSKSEEIFWVFKKLLGRISEREEPDKETEGALEMLRQYLNQTSRELEARNAAIRTKDFSLSSKDTMLAMNETSLHRYEKEVERLQSELDNTLARYQDKDHELQQCQEKMQVLRSEHVDKFMEIMKQEARNEREEKEQSLDQYEGQINAPDKKTAKLLESIQHLTAELQESKKARDEWQNRFLSMEDTHAHFAKRITTWTTDKRKLTKQVNDKSKALDSSRADARQLRSAQKKDQSESVAREQEWNEQKADLLQKLRDSKGLNQQYNFTLSDSELCSQWAGLKSKIVQFVDKYTGPMPGLVSLKQLPVMCMTLSPNFLGLLQAPMLRPFAIEAYIWQRVKMKIFNPAGSLAWAGSLGKKFDNLADEAHTLVQQSNNSLIGEYHKWRSSSSNLLTSLSEPTTDHQRGEERHLQSMVDELSKFCGLKTTEASALDYLKSIFELARTFDIGRRKLRAQLTIQFVPSQEDGTTPKHGFVFNGNFMKNVTPRIGHQPTVQNPKVLLCVSPALFRYGDHQGTNYDKREVLVEMQVLCDMKASPLEDSSQSGAGRRPPAVLKAEASLDSKLQEKDSTTVSAFDSAQRSPMRSTAQSSQKSLAVGYNGKDYSTGCRRSSRNASANTKRSYCQDDMYMDAPDEFAGPSRSGGRNASADRRPNKKHKTDTPYIEITDDGDADFQP